MIALETNGWTVAWITVLIIFLSACFVAAEFAMMAAKPPIMSAGSLAKNAAPTTTIAVAR